MPTEPIVTMLEPQLGGDTTSTRMPVDTANSFGALEHCEEELPVVTSPSNSKKRKNKSPVAKKFTHPVIIGLGAPKATNIIAKVSSMEVENYTKVSGKKKC